jgi:hypothetical protein
VRQEKRKGIRRLKMEIPESSKLLEAWVVIERYCVDCELGNLESDRSAIQRGSVKLALRKSNSR